MYLDNLMALWVAMEEKTTPEVAFKIVDLRSEGKFNLKPNFDWTPENEEDLVKLRNQGLTIYELGEIYGVGFYTISRRLKKIRERGIEVC